MTKDAARLRNDAQRCRRLADYVSNEKDQAMFTRLASDFDEAADEIERDARRSSRAPRE